jgi:hypothetical protein
MTDINIVIQEEESGLSFEVRKGSFGFECDLTVESTSNVQPATKTKLF